MNTHCIVYRTGGTDNFIWHRSLAMSREDANKAAHETQKMGYPALVVDYALSVSLGLPEGFEVVK